MSDLKKLRILVSAYYCSPYRGGESAVGWQVATGLAKTHDVTVICGDLSKNGTTRNDITRYLAENSIPDGLHIIHHSLEGIGLKIHQWHRLPGLWFLYYIAYRKWQKQVFKKCQELHRHTPFDLVHHVTVIGFREPGYLWKLGIPFFWGPLSGSPMVPFAFIKDFSTKEKFRWGTRNLMNRLQIQFARHPRNAALAATKIWAVSAEDQATIARWTTAPETMLETGCIPTPNGTIKKRDADEPLRLCWSGLFQGIKALPLLLRGMATLTDSNIHLDVLGHGPEEHRWKNLSAELGLNDRVHWHGMLPREQALHVMNTSHVLVHTSVKEGTPHVVLEALSMGIPVLCHDACGMGIAVNDSCGIKVPLKDPQTSIAHFRHAIEQIYNDPEMLHQLSKGAFERSHELTWNVKIQRFCNAYAESI